LSRKIPFRNRLQLSLLQLLVSDNNICFILSYTILHFRLNIQQIKKSCHWFQTIKITDKNPKLRKGKDIQLRKTNSSTTKLKTLRTRDNATVLVFNFRILSV